MHLLYTRANNADMSIDLTLKLFDHTVLPILTYGSEIFGFENIDILEKIHSNSENSLMLENQPQWPSYMDNSADIQ